ncbi:MAG: vitamin B12 ABC transporter permease BtuC [Halobacteriaceae archaeon]
MVRENIKISGWIFSLSLILVVVMAVSARIGPVYISTVSVIQILLDPLPVIHYSTTRTNRIIVLHLRLPRIMLGAIVGIGLATAGAVMQGFFRNPMADPSIIGVSSGAAVGAVAIITTQLDLPFGIPFAAFIGAIIAAFAVYLIATTNGRTPVATLLLAGVAIQTFLGAIVSFLLITSPRHALRDALFWLMGSLRNSDWVEVQITIPVVVMGFIILYLFHRDLNILMLGEEDAHALGLEVEWTKRLLLGIASIITAGAVMFVGVIGFVGLIVPHIMRLLVGPDHRILLPTSALAGGIFLVAADTLARTIAQGLPVGVVTAFVGAPFFIYLLRNQEVYEL